MVSNGTEQPWKGSYLGKTLAISLELAIEAGTAMTDRDHSNFKRTSKHGDDTHVRALIRYSR